MLDENSKVNKTKYIGELSKVTQFLKLLKITSVHVATSCHINPYYLLPTASLVYLFIVLNWLLFFSQNFRFIAAAARIRINPLPLDPRLNGISSGDIQPGKQILERIEPL